MFKGNTTAEKALIIISLSTVLPYLLYRLYQVNSILMFGALLGCIPSVIIILKSKG